jgi:hypothetical protein
MPFRFQTDTHLIRVDCSGTLTRDDLFGLLDELQIAERAHAVVPNRMTVLLDVVVWNVRSADFRDIAEMRKATQFPNPFKSAIVAAQSPQLGIARMFQLLNTHPKITFGIFDTVDAASEWLRAI